MFIKPLHNFKVRDPILKDHLPIEGREVTPSPYWTRRITENAIEVVEDISDQQEKTTKTTLKTSKGVDK